MCFSNLPVEFDEDGDPYLAEDADEVDHVPECGCGTDVAIDEADPEEVVEAVLESVPESVREQIEGSGDDRTRPKGGGTPDGSTADGPADGRAGGD